MPGKINRSDGGCIGRVYGLAIQHGKRALDVHQRVPVVVEARSSTRINLMHQFGSIGKWLDPADSSSGVTLPSSERYHHQAVKYPVR